MRLPGLVSFFVHSGLGWLAVTASLVAGLWVFPFESLSIHGLSGYFGISSPEGASLRPERAEASTLVASSPTFLFPVFNQRGVDELLTRIAPQMKAGDGVIVVTGNNDNALDLPWLQASATRINDALPETKVYAMTAGLEHVRQINDGNISGIAGVIYDYEPKFPNEPEFDYSFAKTQANVAEFARILSGSGLQSVLLPTGLPLNKSWAQKHGWDYAALGAEGDLQIIQTQTYCKSSASEFESAIERATAQHSALGMGTAHWMPQITVDPKAPNGVSPAAAAECFAHAVAAGHSRAMVWWSPYRTAEALEFLSMVRS
jgi:hypothetical protein